MKRVLIFLIYSFFIAIQVGNAQAQSIQSDNVTMQNSTDKSSEIIDSDHSAIKKENIAEIETSVMPNLTLISSSYNIYMDNGKKPQFQVKLEKQRVFTQLSSDEAYYFQVFEYGDKKSKNNPAVFSKKHMPRLELVLKGEKTNIVFKNPLIFNENFIMIGIRKGTLDNAFVADKVYLVLDTENGVVKQIEIPNSVVLQWQKVVNTDMKKLRSELNNR